MANFQTLNYYLSFKMQGYYLVHFFKALVTLYVPCCYAVKASNIGLCALDSHTYHISSDKCPTSF